MLCIDQRTQEIHDYAPKSQIEAYLFVCLTLGVIVNVLKHNGKLGKIRALSREKIWHANLKFFWQVK